MFHTPPHKVVPKPVPTPEQVAQKEIHQLERERLEKKKEKKNG